MENMKPNRPPQQDADEIAVAELHFDVGNRPPTLPLEEPKTVPTMRSDARIAIVYLPRKRFYRITERARHAQAKDIVIYVPETWALWTPAAS